MKNTLLLRNAFLISTLVLWFPLISSCTSTPYRESAGEYVDSSALTTKVKSALFADNEIKGFSINVVTFKDNVELSGFVDSYHVKRKAVRIAQRVHGVRSVIDNIVVKTSLK